MDGPAGQLPASYGLRALVVANVDYIVDAVSRQLRSLGAHPRAPQLLAALLRKAGVAPQLLPLLAEPARAALQVCGWMGVGGTRRRGGRQGGRAGMIVGYIYAARVTW